MRPEGSKIIIPQNQSLYVLGPVHFHDVLIIGLQFVGILSSFFFSCAGWGGGGSSVAVGSVGDSVGVG